METTYIAFQEPDMAAVKLINPVPFFETFSASIKHRDNENGSIAEYTFQFRAKPKWPRPLLEPIMLKLLKAETAKRLKALSVYLETTSSLL